MSEYKLVPVERLKDWHKRINTIAIETALDVADEMGTMLEAAPPDVQGEPVYLYRRLGLHDFVTCNHDRYAELSVKPHLFETKVLYAAPQPTEQQPELAKYQPCGCVVCTCDHETQCQGCGAKHCGTHPIGQLYKPAYQQPVPDDRAAVRLDEQRREDVADALGFVPGGNYAWTYLLKQIKEIIIAEEKQPAPDVSALVEALEWIRGAINCTPENDKHQSGAWISTRHPRIRQIDELLAAHRKGDCK